jgi:hypothetical protein
LVSVGSATQVPLPVVDVVDPLEPDVAVLVPDVEPPVAIVLLLVLPDDVPLSLPQPISANVPADRSQRTDSRRPMR